MLNSIKIGGIWFGYNQSEIRKKNITDRIDKAKKILQKWQFARFTLEGNIILAKTFGLSQFIHLMQSIHINLEDLKKIETVLFHFIWRGIDKIKRSTLQSDFENGGLKAPDPISLNTSLKLKSFFRLSFIPINHPIKNIWLTSDTLIGENPSSNLKSINQKDYLLQLKLSKGFISSCYSAFKYYNFLIKAHLGKIANNPCHIKYKTLCKC